jgi:glyoxylase-like metal-dependent hydrolase (beta-lactamase superfamily II)
MHAIMLPPDMHFIERGWLSSNSLLLTGPNDTVLIDSGYHTHAEQTLALVRHALRGRPLNRLINTHLHSDHCGGNAAVQTRWPSVRTSIPPGCAEAVRLWDEAGLTYKPTGQSCPCFRFDDVLQPGTPFGAGGRSWEVHAAPGHDPDSVLLFQPDTGVLLSADALWENGFGVVFPEIYGEPGFDDVGRTLDLIEQLQPTTIVPGHGRVFTDVSGALARARERLKLFMEQPLKHASHAAKVLIKFHLMDIQGCPVESLHEWAQTSSYLKTLHRSHFQQQTMREWTGGLMDALVRSGVLAQQGDRVVNV